MRLRQPTKAARLAAHYRDIGADETAAAIEADLTRDRRCIRCGRQLTDPVSVERRVGPECWAYLCEARDAGITT